MNSEIKSALGIFAISVGLLWGCTSADPLTEPDTDTGIIDMDTATASETDTVTEAVSDADSDSDADTDADGDTAPTPLADVLSYDSDYVSCGDLTIEGGVVLNDTDDIAALSGVTDIAGNLYLMRSTLADLSGLEKLQCIGGDVIVYESPGLRDFTGLYSLRKIGGDLLIGTEQDGFECIRSFLTSFSGLGLLEQIGGALSIQCATNPNGLSFGGLNSLRRVGSLKIGKFENKWLYVGPKMHDWVNVCNPLEIKSLQGLNLLQEVDDTVSIFCVDNLESLDGLNSLQTIGGSLELGIEDGDGGFLGTNIQSVEALSALTTIGGDLSVVHNGGLSQLTGLENLTTVGGAAAFFNNWLLSDVSALVNLASVEEIRFVANGALPTCSIEALVSQYTEASPTIIYYDNKEDGCPDVGAP